MSAVIYMLLEWACAIVILFVSLWFWYELSSPFRSGMTKRERELLTAERDGRPAFPCQCGPRRYQITDPADEHHYARTGCWTCSVWDVPKASVRKPL